MHNEKELLSRVSTGDEDAFRTLLNAYRKPVYSLALFYLKFREKAEDAVQDVFLKIWDQRHQLPAVERFDAWIFCIARNHIFTGLKAKMAKAGYDGLSEPLLDDHHRPDRLLETKQTDHLIQNAIRLLPDCRRKIFLLSRQEELTYEQIAGRLQISKLAVKGQIALALNFLRRYMITRSDNVAGLIIGFILSGAGSLEIFL